MKKILCAILLIVMISSCRSKIKIDIDKRYHGWIYVVEARRLKTLQTHVKPDTNGIIYLATEAFDRKLKIELYEDGHAIGLSKILNSYQGTFFSSKSKRGIRYMKFHYPSNAILDDDSSIVTPDGRMIMVLEYLIEQKKINPELVY